MSGGWFYGQKELSDLLVHQCKGWKVVEGRSETKEQMEENPKRCKITFQMQVWKLHEFLIPRIDIFKTTRSQSTCRHDLKNHICWGAWVAQSVGRLTTAQVMISWSVSSSPALGSVLTAQSLEPASNSVPPSLCPFLAWSLSLSLSKIINIKNIYKY